MRLYRLPYVSKMPVVPLRMHELPSDDVRLFEGCLIRRIRRLNEEQVEELGGVFARHATDAITDGIQVYTLHNHALWEGDFARFVDDSSQEPAFTE